MPDTNYAPLPLFKEYLAIPASDDTRDTLLAYAVASASRTVDKDTGRRFWLDDAPVARTFDTAGRVLEGGLLLVPDIGDVDGLVVELGAGATWTAVPGADVTYSPLNALAGGSAYTGLVRAAGWPGAPSQVRVTARWGWPAVPLEITQATLIRAAALFKRQDSVEGVVGSGDWGAVRVSTRKDPDYADLISRYVIHAFA